MLEITFTPRDPSNPANTNSIAKNAVIDRITKVLGGWSPVSDFPGPKRFSMQHQNNGIFSVRMDFLIFRVKDEIVHKALVEMFKKSGIDADYYISGMGMKGDNHVVSVNGSLERGYCYPIQAFPDLVANGAGQGPGSLIRMTITSPAQAAVKKAATTIQHAWRAHHSRCKATLFSKLASQINNSKITIDNVDGYSDAKRQISSGRLTEAKKIMSKLESNNVVSAARPRN